MTQNNIYDDLYDGQAFERSVDMQGSGCSHVRWTVDMEAREITMAVLGPPGASWVALGLSEFGSMMGADIAMVRAVVDGDGDDDKFVVDDLVSHGFVAPEKDVLQHVELVYAKVDNQDRLQAVLRRKLDTCDKDDMAIKANQQNLICASGSVDAANQAMYHGTSRAKALVNLVFDEDLLVKRNIDFNYESERRPLLDDTVIAHVPKSPTEANSQPFAVDFQMPRITLDPSKRTSYRCMVFEMPEDINVIAYESVWNNGTTIQDEPQPTWLHHQNVRYCPEPDEIKPEWRNGEPFDCFENFPPCSVKLGHAQNGFMQTPSGVHLPLYKKRTYLLTVHYDNLYEAKIENDTSGIRAWAEPLSSKSQSTAGQVSYFRSDFSTIHVPSDPEQRIVERQFMISSAATRATLPPEGVQVFATHVHMHIHGVGARAKLIRNGVHIQNVIEMNHYDFNLQAPQYGLWRLLPGDALEISCFYRPLPNEDITGGWNTVDEMCDLIFGMAPEPEGFTFGVGYMVEPGQPFRNSYIGHGNGTTAKNFDISQAIYPPDSRDYVPLKDHRINVCDLAIRDVSQQTKARFSSPEIPALLYLLAAFAFLYSLPKFWKKVGAIQGERERRNLMVYTIQLVFSVVALPIVARDLADVYTPEVHYDAVDPHAYELSRGILAAQQILFLVELFYRIEIRPVVWVHHVLSVLIFVYLNLVVVESLAFPLIFKLGSLLTLMAVTEQPMYVALLLKNLGHANRRWWPWLCRAAGWLFVLTKVLFVILSFVALAKSKNGKDSSWEISDHSFSDWNKSDTSWLSSRSHLTYTMAILLAFLHLSQLYTGWILLKLARRYESKNRQRQQTRKSYVKGDTIDFLACSQRHIDSESDERVANGSVPTSSDVESVSSSDVESASIESVTSEP